jgi:hypothetical protein
MWSICWGLLAWCTLSFPLGVVTGRALQSAESIPALRDGAPSSPDVGGSW